MPGWLQAFTNYQPIPAAASAVRALVVGGPTATDVWHSIAWDLGILAVFATLAVRLYRRAV
jgi:oleandomycin transport system permease protein